jgi:hypothetical protein
VDPRTPADQHDTVVLALPAPPPPPPALPAGLPAPSGWQQVPNVWSQVPPFLAPAAAPVMVMRNNAAVVGATLGSVSLFLSLLPLIGIVAWVLAPIGLLTSTVGLFVGMTRKVGRVGALWGILSSGLALLVCLAWTALVLAL